MNDMKTFSVEIDPETVDWDSLNEMMHRLNSEMDEYIKSEAKKLGIAYGYAADIVYLRTRSRWTQEKEDYLLFLAREGKEFPLIYENFEVP